jgi:hypothetical protein
MVKGLLVFLLDKEKTKRKENRTTRIIPLLPPLSGSHQTNLYTTKRGGHKLETTNKRPTIAS